MPARAVHGRNRWHSHRLARVLLQSKEALSDPRCLLELYTAATAGIPIVLLACSSQNQDRYDAAVAEEHLLHLSSSLSPADAMVLEYHNVPVQHAAHVLAASIPNCTSVPFNSVGSESATRAAVTALAGAMQRAQPVVGVVAAADFDPSMLRARQDELDEEAVKRGATCALQSDRMLRMIDGYAKLEAALARKEAQLSAEVPQLVQDLLRENERLNARENERLLHQHDRDAAEKLERRKDAFPPCRTWSVLCVNAFR